MNPHSHPYLGGTALHSISLSSLLSESSQTGTVLILQFLDARVKLGLVVWWNQYHP